jgi:hypothetical protein
MPAQSLEIVTHVYCPPGVDIYAEHLRWQFASLYRHQPTGPTTLTICYTRTDAATAAVLARIRGIVQQAGRLENLQVQALDFEPGALFRRAIGRNYAAKRTRADAIWFTDADYCFGPGAIAAVLQLVEPTSQLVQPESLWIHTTHALGDADLEAGRSQEFPDIQPEHFSRRRQKVCIGGVQIVGGDTARRLGYCQQTKWVQPVDPAQGFRSCRCDRAFRKLNNFHALRLPIPQVYRLRHGTDGRDYDLDGQARGREVW